MRRFLLLFFVISFCFVASAEARKYALLVGVDEYVNVSSLKCCVNDMKTLKEALIKIGFEEDDIRLLVTGGPYKDLPTKNNIELTFSKIVSNAQPSDMVFIAFSGHGAQEGNNVYFCPPDVRTNNLKGTCVSITDAMRILANKCKAKFKWMVVDACRNDPTQSAKGIGGKGLQVIPTPPAGIALFQSCAAGEESWEDIASGNGYFTKNFAAALSGAADANHDGKLTLLEVCSWTTAHTKEQVKNSQNKSQRPYFSGSVTDFTLSEDLNVPKAKVLVEEARAAMKVKNYPLAIAKYDAAIALCPKFNSIRREREIVNNLLNAKSQANPMQISVPGDCKTIEEAYAKVMEGGIITIESGKYYLSAKFVVDRSVSFRGGTGFAKDVVISSCTSDVIKITGGSPSFENLTVQSEAENSCCFNIVGGTPKLFRCTIVSTKGNGMYIKGENVNPKVELCTIKDCKLSGALIDQNGLGEFYDCEFFGNSAMGIEIKESGNPTVTECKIHDGKKSGVWVSNKGLGEFNSCEIYGNAEMGIEIKESGNPTFTECKIHDGQKSGVWVSDNGLGTFNNCEIYGNTNAGVDTKTAGNPTFTKCKIHDGKSAGVYVTENGLGKFKDCEIYSNANTEKSCGDGIVITESGNPTFTGCIIRCDNISFNKKGLGEFRNCEITGWAAKIYVFDSSNPTFTECKIHNGSAHCVIMRGSLGTFKDCEIFGYRGLGFVIGYSSNPTIIGCKLHDLGAGGVSVFERGLGTIKDCDIYNNGCGIITSTSGNPTVIECKIHDMKNAGVVSNKDSTGTIKDCDIYGNKAAGITVHDEGNLTVTGCKIHDGKGGGIEILAKGMGSFNDNVLENNYKDEKLTNWDIAPDAGEVKGSGNTPPIPIDSENRVKKAEQKRREEEERKRREEAEKNDLSIPGKMEVERKTVIVNGVEFAFRWCPPGTFVMGAPKGEHGQKELSEKYKVDYDKIEKQHEVTLTKGFWMMETEVTVGMFKAFVNDKGYKSKGYVPYGLADNKIEADSQYSWRNPGFSQDDNHPVTCVSWDDAVEFCKWLSKKTGQNITLPTEAQWEYACRAGTTGAHPGNLNEMAWWVNVNNSTHPVGTKKANAWGLYDMIGNVMEWCADWFGDYPSGTVTDPTGPASGSDRVFRGGSCFNSAWFCRSANRGYFDPGARFCNLGFRCAMSIASPEN
ncbi:MAG: right-handed parallel beta-helix repeat-containing protein [Thermoguttaceae bacterium]|nr:right-handed parallel beta-helix repeat-containing protein [Thermoguttaceae bacterium]